MVLAAAYGITDEVHQYFVPGRMGIWQDWVADAVGALLGAWLAWFASGYLAKGVGKRVQVDS